MNEFFGMFNIFKQSKEIRLSDKHCRCLFIKKIRNIYI